MIVLCLCCLTYNETNHVSGQEAQTPAALILLSDTVVLTQRFMFYGDGDIEGDVVG